MTTNLELCATIHYSIAFRCSLTIFSWLQWPVLVCGLSLSLSLSLSVCSVSVCECVSVCSVCVSVFGLYWNCLYSVLRCLSTLMRWGRMEEQFRLSLFAREHFQPFPFKKYTIVRIQWTPLFTCVSSLRIFGVVVVLLLLVGTDF